MASAGAALAADLKLEADEMLALVSTSSVSYCLYQSYNRCQVHNALQQNGLGFGIETAFG
jgi:hypothetical protein